MAAPAPFGAEARARQLRATHDLFEGRVVLDLGSDWQVLPAAGPGMEFLALSARGLGGGRVSPVLELAKDSADNYYVRAKTRVTAELRYRVAVPASYFGRPVAEGLPFRAPASIPAEVRQALGLMGLIRRRRR